MSESPVAHFYRPETFMADESVGYLMKQAMLSFSQQMDKRLAPHDLTTAQWGPLMRLQKFGDMTMAELSRCLSIDAGALTRTFDRLEKKGLVRRERSQEDRRVVLVGLTDEGRDALKHVPGELCQVLNEHLAGFTEEEWLTLKSLLRRINANGERLRDGD